MISAETNTGVRLVEFDTGATGAYAVVLGNLDRTRAFKLFRSEASDQAPRPDKMRRAVFRSEVDAYRIATNDSTLSRYVPDFFGEHIIANVRNGDGKSCDQFFLLDCCYEMELIHGRAIKFADAVVKDPQLKAIISAFHEKGICYVAQDASFIVGPNGVAKIIDFATYDAHDSPSLW